MRRLLVLVLLALVASCGDGAPQVGPSPGSTTEPAATATATPDPSPTSSPTGDPFDPAATPTPTPSLDPGLLPPVPTAPPEQAVAITEDHRVVLVDPATGDERRTLATFDDPETFEEETGEPIAAGSFVDGLAVAPDGETAYLALCCEPAPGRIERLAIEGGEPEQVAFGADPAVRGDGQRIAVVELQWLVVLDADGEDVHRVEGGATGPTAVMRPAWSPDGRTLAFELHDEGLSRPQVLLVASDAASLDDARPLGGGDGPPWSRPTFDRQGRLVVVEQDLDDHGSPQGPATQLVLDPASGEVLERRELPTGVRSQVHDASGAYLLAVLADGTARWWGPDGTEGTFGGGLRSAGW